MLRSSLNTSLDEFLSCMSTKIEKFYVLRMKEIERISHDFIRLPG